MGFCEEQKSLKSDKNVNSHIPGYITKTKPSDNKVILLVPAFHISLFLNLDRKKKLDITK